MSCAAKRVFSQVAGDERGGVRAFAEAWFALLDALRAMGEAATCEELREAVPEAAKNMLLVMSAQGVLARARAAGALGGDVEARGGGGAQSDARHRRARKNFAVCHFLETECTYRYHIFSPNDKTPRPKFE